MNGDNNQTNGQIDPPSEELTRLGMNQPQKKKSRIGLKIFLGLLFVSCIVFLAAVGMIVKIAKEGPALDFKKLDDSQRALVYAANETLIETYGDKNREVIETNEIPPAIKAAITSIEDKRFNKHIGIDPIRIAGAALSNFKSGGGSLQGGSTLTQQLIKLSYAWTDVKDQTYVRKIQEAWLAIQLEKEKSKDEIISYYINKVYMGNGFYGMQTAANGYYGKSLADLSIAQTALMAGIPQSPRDYDPIAFPEQATTRRNLVLAEMFKDEKINEKEYNDALAEDVTKGLITTQPGSEYSKFIDNYIKQVLEEVQSKTTRDIYTEGVEIYTNLDLDAQKYIYHVVNSDEYINFTDYNDEDLQENLQVAITVMDPKNGQVVAQLGGRKVPEDVQLGANLAVSAERDFGSTVKPITDYAPAIDELNYSTGRYVLDAPYTYPNTNLSLYNYDRQYRGNLTIREALIDSRNIPAVKTLEEVGLDKSKDFLKRLGIEYEKGLNFSNAIMGDPSSLQMAAAYSAFANGGIYYQPYYVNRIVFADGQEETFKPQGKRAMKESTAYMITDMLKDVLTRGTGTTALVPDLIQAGKTGTSNYTDDAKDKLLRDVYGGVPDISFVGYTTDYVIAIWTGYSQYLVPISLGDQQNAMLLYKYIMGYISQNKPVKDWEMPEDVVKIGNELYVKDHVNDQSSWKASVYSSSSYEEPASTERPTSSSSSSSSSSDSSTSSSVVAPPSTTEPPVEPSEPPVESSVDPPVEPEPTTSSSETDSEPVGGG